LTDPDDSRFINQQRSGDYMTASIATSQTILVVGGGISGMTAALEAAECGRDVVLVERSPTLGGRTALLYRYFPKMCHPTCGLEINLRRLKGNRRVRVITMAELVQIEGQRGAYKATLKIRPRYVNENCTACGDCAKAIEAEVPNPYNYGQGQIKAAHLPFAMAYPQRYVLDPSLLGSDQAEIAKAACKVGAVDLDMKEETVDLEVGAVIWATGWKPYDAAKIQPYGYGRFPNVMTNVEFERLADPAGPTAGKLLRPSDGQEAKNIAFIQCAGSRDENHLRHCSRICCMATLKQAAPSRRSITSTSGPSTALRISTRRSNATRASPLSSPRWQALSKRATAIWCSMGLTPRGITATPARMTWWYWPPVWSLSLAASPCRKT
jgi:quinone-modifying oxidoreductase subunit QmoA